MLLSKTRFAREQYRETPQVTGDCAATTKAVLQFLTLHHARPGACTRVICAKGCYNPRAMEPGCSIRCPVMTLLMGFLELLKRRTTYLNPPAIDQRRRHAITGHEEHIKEGSLAASLTTRSNARGAPRHQRLCLSQGFQAGPKPNAREPFLRPPASLLKCDSARANFAKPDTIRSKVSWETKLFQPNGW